MCHHHRKPSSHVTMWKWDEIIRLNITTNSRCCWPSAQLRSSCAILKTRLSDTYVCDTHARQTGTLKSLWLWYLGGLLANGVLRSQFGVGHWNVHFHKQQCIQGSVEIDALDFRWLGPCHTHNIFSSRNKNKRKNVFSDRIKKIVSSFIGMSRVDWTSIEPQRTNRPSSFLLMLWYTR